MKANNIAATGDNLYAVDSDGQVWEYMQSECRKHSAWVPLQMIEGQIQEQPVPAPNRFEDGRLWVGGCEVVRFTNGKLFWRGAQYTTEEMCAVMVQPEFLDYGWVTALQVLGKIDSNQ